MINDTNEGLPKLEINRVYQGDCLELMKNIPNKSVDMILCDLPYGTTNCKWDTIIPFESLWEQYKRIIKDNKATVLFGKEPFSSYLRTSNIQNYKYDWIWDKVKPGTFASAKHQPLKQHELISIFYKKSSSYIPQMVDRDKPKTSKQYSQSLSANCTIDGMKRTYTKLYPKTILKYSNAHQKGKVHPTQKPVALIEYLIKTYTQENDTVLDFTMGSGTTGVACKNLNRSFIGIEKDDKYFEIAKQRIEL
jgi:site-specific DNA-methyltransferase (adenine-specific)